uniref:Uncharacterized protein n=1 Tax=Fibrocapsa japonica TaxID=94617 RepID=A0A7S2V4Q7_9STRA
MHSSVPVKVEPKPPSSDSADDMPLSSIGKHSAPKEESDSDDDIPLAKLHHKPAQPPPKVKKEEPDSDDDLPLSSLHRKQPSPKPSRTTNVPVKREQRHDKERSQKKRLSSSSSSKASEAAKRTKVQAAKASFYANTIKAQLVYKLLCRWWYAIEWPSPEVKNKPLTPGHMAMQGFPGVSICIKGDNIGHLEDNRDIDSCPNFSNLIQKDSEELCALLKTALKEQMRELIQHEGEGTETQASIKAEFKWLKKLNPHEVERKAMKAAAKAAQA